MLGRARKRTLVVDAGRQSNLVARGIGGLLGHDGRSPAELYAAGRDELADYPTVDLRSGEVLSGERRGAGFVLELADGSREAARRVLLATGMDYRVPELPGIAERWGRSVFHCPFCHGWEVRDQALGVLERGAEGVQRALLLRGWSDDVTLLSDGSAELDAEAAERLRAAGITVDERPVAGLRGAGDAVTAIAFADGSERPCDGLMVPVPCTSVPRSRNGWARSPPAGDPSPPRPWRSTRPSAPACRACRPRATSAPDAVRGHRDRRRLERRRHDRDGPGRRGARPPPAWRVTAVDVSAIVMGGSPSRGRSSCSARPPAPRPRRP